MVTTGTSVVYVPARPAVSVQGHSQLTAPLGNFTLGLRGGGERSCPTHVPFIAYKALLVLVNVDSK